MKMQRDKIILGTLWTAVSDDNVLHILTGYIDDYGKPADLKASFSVQIIDGAHRLFILQIPYVREKYPYQSPAVDEEGQAAALSE